MAQSPPLIATRGLTKRYGDETAVEDLTLEVPAGVIFGYIGPSGCGKTTTVKLLTGLAEPTEGEATVLGASPQAFGREERQKIGYMPQLFALYPSLSVRENLHFAASLYGLKWRGRDKRLGRLLDLVELTGHDRKVARDISGGMQRRLSLAAALVHEPSLLFLDEPTAGIDPILRRKLWDFFEALKGEGQTLFVTTQYVGEAAYCDYVGIMAEGRLITVETPEGLRRAAYHGDLIDVRLTQRLRGAQVAALEAHPLLLKPIAFLDALTYRLTVEEAGTALPEMVRWFEEQALEVESISEFLPPFDDVFTEIIKRETGDE